MKSRRKIKKIKRAVKKTGPRKKIKRIAKRKKKIIKTPVRHRRKKAKITQEVIYELINKSRGRGFITEQEIIRAIPHLEEDIAGLEEFYDRLKEAHVKVLERKDYIDIEEEEEVDGKSKKKLKKLLAGLEDIDSVQMYLKEIGKTELLSGEEEEELAKRLEKRDEEA